MPGRPELPGFYYDEERNRYFAIPPARTEAEPAREIHTISEKAQEQKRRKLESSRPPPSPVELLQQDYKMKQESFFLQLGQATELDGPANTAIQTIAAREYCNEIIRERPFQMIQEYRTLYLGGNNRRFVGFRLGFDLSHTDSFRGLYLYVDGTGGHTLDAKIEDHVDVKDAGPVEEIRYDHIDVSISRLPDTAAEYHFMGRNGGVIFNDYMDDAPDFTSVNMNIVIDECSWCGYANNRQVVKLKGREAKTVKSDVTCMDAGHGAVAYGCRDGRAVVVLDGDPGHRDVIIRIGSPICGVTLLELHGILYCVVSAMGDKLISYSIDPFSKAHKIHLVHQDYRSGVRLSQNMKHDRHSQGIFAVESESADASKMQLQFYSVLCPAPLKMVSGPFLVSNSSTANIEWALIGNSLIHHDRDKSLLRFYKSYSPCDI